MTRTHVKYPVWAWHCDRCDTTAGFLAREQRGLPTADEMRAFGWFIADNWGDLCPACRSSGEGA